MAEGKQSQPTKDCEKDFGFKKVELFKTETLGNGSYGAVCKAKCDELICAAKILHPILFGIQQQNPSSDGKHRHPFQRFELECRFLSRLNHPNIIQYLGTYRDPDTNVLVLLMELMDESLTHFLESSSETLPYHVQVNICYDIAQALHFLHSNEIIHRDLSSNNVLLIAGNRAKVTDFGMSKFADDVAATHLATMTTCPGTPVFMPPEALNEPPVYTEKLDNFSLGVVIVQVVTRKYPKPTDRYKTMDLINPSIPGQIIQAKVPVPELERRNAHISLIEGTHPLLPVAVPCLRNKDTERPSSQQLCQTLGAIKEATKYVESSQRDKDQLLQAKDDQLDKKEDEIKQYREKLEQSKQDCLVLQDEAEARMKQLRNEITCKGKITRDLSVQLQLMMSENGQQQALVSDQETTAHAEEVQLVWETLPDAPVKMMFEEDSILYRISAASGNKAYFKTGPRKLYEYSLHEKQWSELPKHPINPGVIVCIDDKLTSVGEDWRLLTNSPISNKLYSLIDNKWVEHFPPMPTKRQLPSVVFTNNALVVAGGFTSVSIIFKQFKMVEILDTRNKQWSSAHSLPLPMIGMSISVCRDHLYIHIRPNILITAELRDTVLKCSLSALIDSSQQATPTPILWQNITDLPVYNSSLAVVNGHLLAIGGNESPNTRTKEIRIYNPATNSWKVISQMSVARSKCLTAVFPDCKLMVVGSEKKGDRKKVELASLV